MRHPTWRRVARALKRWWSVTPLHVKAGEVLIGPIIVGVTLVAVTAHFVSTSGGSSSQGTKPVGHSDAPSGKQSTPSGTPSPTDPSQLLHVVKIVTGGDQSHSWLDVTFQNASTVSSDITDVTVQVSTETCDSIPRGPLYKPQQPKLLPRSTDAPSTRLKPGSKDMYDEIVYTLDERVPGNDVDRFRLDTSPFGPWKNFSGVGVCPEARYINYIRFNYDGRSQPYFYNLHTPIRIS